MKQALNVVWFLVALFSLGGCADPNVAYVTGTVTASREIPSGTRLFFEKPGTGYVAAAVIAADGSYELNYRRESKIEPGDYTVYVGAPKSTMSQKEYFDLKKKVEAEYRKRGEKPPLSPDWVLPAEYYQSSTSPLKESVEAGENVIAIEIE